MHTSCQEHASTLQVRSLQLQCTPEQSALAPQLLQNRKPVLCSEFSHSTNSLNSSVFLDQACKPNLMHALTFQSHYTPPLWPSTRSPHTHFHGRPGLAPAPPYFHLLKCCSIKSLLVRAPDRAALRPWTGKCVLAKALRQGRPRPLLLQPCPPLLQPWLWPSGQTLLSVPLPLPVQPPASPTTRALPPP